MKTQIKSSGAQKRRPYFDRKVRKEGGSLSLSLGKVLPKTWKYVRLIVKKQDDNRILLEINKLYEEAYNAKKRN